ncbi:MAG: (Fe-S)-binding protein [Myxococcales bacterium]|nr:(Fe-S)-binding protein [Myxococcales bacterium]
MNPPVMALLLILSLAIFSYSAARRWALLRVGTAEPRFSVRSLAELSKRLRLTLVYGFGQKKMPTYPVAGIAHTFIFFGFLVLLLRSVMLWGRGFDGDFDFWGLLAQGSWAASGYSLTKDVFSVLVMLGAMVFVYYRVFSRPKRMTLSAEGLVILFIIITMMLADLLYDASSIVLDAHADPRSLALRYCEPASSLLAMGLAKLKLSPIALHILQHTGFWWHASFVLIFLNLLPYSKHFHVITALPNVFAASDLPRGTLPIVSDLEGRVEREEPLGFRTISDLSWKDMLDLYTCTECGRCTEHCPASLTDKKLSPKHLTVALRDHLYDSEAHLVPDGLVALEDLNTFNAVAQTPLKIGGDPPPNAYFRSAVPVKLVPGILHPDVIWACTTCRACEQECPVNISYVDKIVKLRREKLLVDAEFPTELQKPFTAIETQGNPWNLSKRDRPRWADDLDVPLISDRPDARIVYWVGCAASYDERAKKIARATVKLLKHAAVDFAILGEKERCTGDPARRAGNEYVFQNQAQANVQTLTESGAQRKTLLTACPHCFNTLKNEYPAFGGHFSVVHHTDFLLELVMQKKLIPKKRVSATVAFHDSCYLGRYNDIYESPRQILASIPGIELREVPDWNRERGLCCGAGGAQMFMEEQNDNRVNNKRTLQLLETGANTIATACPFCVTMIQDGLKAADKEEAIASLDVAEVLERSVL